MGFWNVVGRMIQGKPAFEVPSEPPVKDDWGDEEAKPAAAASAPDLRRDAHGNKIIPEAWVGRCKYHLSGNHMQVYADIQNHSSVPVFLDKIQLAGQTRELDYELQPGRSWEFRIYDGPALTSGAYTEANLYYRDNGNGDYFRARHFVEYNMEGSNYCIEELHPVRPVMDV